MPALSQELRRSLERNVTEHQAELWGETDHARRALGYLRGRGIDEGMAHLYRLGLVSASSAEHSLYTGMISIPYLTRLGGAVAVKFRQVRENQDSPKYLAPPGQPSRIFNPLAFDQADRTGVIGITEGELDALVLEWHCGIPAVGIPGVETWKAHPEWKELFRGYGRVLMFPDSDDPGMRLASAVRADVEQCQVVPLGNYGEDVTAVYLAAGIETIRKAAGID